MAYLFIEPSDYAVVLDSSVLCRDFNLDGPIRLLFGLVEDEYMTLYVPEVVIQETTRRYVEEARRKLGAVQRALKALGRHLRQQLIEPTIPSDEGLENEYENSLRQWLSRHAEFLPVPQLPHEAVLQRIHHRRSPSRNGDRGYRDILIWESILELLRAVDGAQVAFITADRRDFGDQGDARLAGDLREELDKEGLGGRVELFGDVNAFLDASSAANADLQERLSRRIVSDPSFRNVWQSAMVERSAFEPEGATIGSPGLKESEEVSHQQFVVQRVEGIKVSSARLVQGHRAFSELILQCRGVFDPRSLRELALVDSERRGAWSERLDETVEKEAFESVECFANLHFDALIDEELMLPNVIDYFWLEIGVSGPSLRPQEETLF